MHELDLSGFPRISHLASLWDTVFESYLRNPAKPWGLLLYASGSSDWNWETWIDIQTLSPNMSATLGITSQSLHFQICKMEVIKPVQQCTDELNHVKAQQVEKTKCLLSAHFLLDHGNYTEF